MDAIVQMVEEGKKKVLNAKINTTDEEGSGSAAQNETDTETRTVRNWVSIEQAGLHFRGRFVTTAACSVSARLTSVPFRPPLCLP